MLLVAVQRSTADSMFSFSERSGADEPIEFAPAPIYVSATRRTLGHEQHGSDTSVSGSGSSAAVDDGDEAKIESAKKPVSSP